MIKTIVIEDDSDIGTLLKEYLFSYHIDVDNYLNSKSAMVALTQKTYDLAIVDLGLPDISGFELCKHIALNYGIPIVIFSARDNLNDKLRAFELGADDYIVKTVEPLELVARIKAVNKRKTQHVEYIEKTKEIFEINEEKMTIFKNGVDLALSSSEYEILKYFIKHKHELIDKSAIADILGVEQSTRNIDMLISRLRHKIEEDHKKPQYLKNIWGAGYKFIC